jgi:vacuolar-type H+-ATPase catalytic subunit A/Vma1
MKDQQTIQLKDIKPGDDVTAMGTVDETKKTVQAMMVRDIDAATVAKAKENMGKTYIEGKITAIDADNLKLTVMRTDNVSQVIAVDDGTSFLRGTRAVAADVTAAGGLPTGGGFGGGRAGGGGFGGGGGGQGRGGAGAGGAAAAAAESITLADIHVGDTVMSTGKLKGGTFTALKMGVAPPVAPGAGRRGAGAAGQAAPAGSTAPATPAQP